MAVHFLNCRRCGPCGDGLRVHADASLHGRRPGSSRATEGEAPKRGCDPPDANLNYAMVESQIAIIKSAVFMRRVADKLQLISDPEFGGGVPGSLGRRA